MNQERVFKIILSPYLSEKVSFATQERQVYAFCVHKSAKKPEIKDAIEQLFKVNVENVNIVNVKAKPRRFGNIKGHTKVWKKAYVKLQAGQKIDQVNA